MKCQCSLHFLGFRNVELSRTKKPQLRERGVSFNPHEACRTQTTEARRHEAPGQDKTIAVLLCKSRAASGSLALGLERKGFTHESQGVQTLSISSSLEKHAQLMDLGLLLGLQVARVAGRGNGGDRGEVIVVVLGVELHGGRR